MPKKRQVYKMPARDTREDFLKKLQEQAELQANLSSTRLLPSHVDWLTARIGSYPWQTLVFLASFSTFLTLLLRGW